MRSRGVDRWAVRLLMIAVALGVVAMHHVVGAHEHGGHGSAHAMAPTSVVASFDRHDPGTDHDAMAGMTHPCAAILVAVAALLLGWALALGGSPIARSATTAVTGSPTSARAPPLPRRLARLQVLRL